MDASGSTQVEYVLQEDDSPPNAHKSKSRKLTLIPLIFLIYFEVSGGPFGEEPAVGAAGPLLAILGFVIFPFIWSIPEALVTAELATAFPGNGGYVIWAERAFGPFWGSLMGNLKFLSGAINNAAYPVLCADYLKVVLPIFAQGLWRDLAILFFNLILTFLNYTGLTIVGYTAVGLGFVSLLPFILMFFFSIPKIQPYSGRGSRAAPADVPKGALFRRHFDLYGIPNPPPGRNRGPQRGSESMVGRIPGGRGGNDRRELAQVLGGGGFGAVGGGTIRSAA
ncbi:hypothetical protein H6P81_000911 [Aristolochia fimbriata]|uniref:Uncharacterized protein n=1 Tax=Aristolochia fimbriata TaxID=158543 RepID=A0AAV7F5Z7_ARIFI|nr:hypothetical protein H6P81_000911 [Aristolochia fimbriata]